MTIKCVHLAFCRAFECELGAIKIRTNGHEAIERYLGFANEQTLRVVAVVVCICGLVRAILPCVHVCMYIFIYICCVNAISRCN